MSNPFVEGKSFQGIHFGEQPLPPGDYESCHFSQCIFTQAQLVNVHLIDCELADCDFSMAKISEVAFRDVTFRRCKLLGLPFEHCHPFLFSVRFEACTLDFSSFTKMALKHTPFIDCRLREVDFTAADLTSASFDGSDLRGAIFEDCILEKADFRNAEHYSIDPEKNRIRKARFSLAGLPGLLEKYKIDLS